MPPIGKPFFVALKLHSQVKLPLANLDGTIVVNGVSRIALPSLDLGGMLRATGTSAVATCTDFVAGPENQLVVPALQRLLAGDDLTIATELFNPLVLLGSTGTGKSHLARGITRHWRKQLGKSAVEYLTAIDFARQLRAAREEGELDSFRERISQLHLLVVEDLQNVPQRTFIQREIRDTLDVLSEAGAMVVVTAQQPPATMSGLDSGLRDRLAGGLTIRLQSPGVEARLELLQQIADIRNYSINADQLQHLANKIDGPVPQLFRAIAEHELATTENSSDVPASTASINTGISITKTRPTLKIKQIIAVVSRYFSLTQAALCSSARRKSLVYARSVTIHLARTLTDQSYAQIGQALGRRDHTTVMHASRTIEKKLVTDATAQQDVEELKRILTAV